MTDKIDKSRRRFLTSATTVLGGVGAAYVASPFLFSWLPSTRAQAQGAPVEVDISKLDPGAQLTIEWRGQPVWIIHRTEQNISDLDNMGSKLRDPFSNVQQQPEYAKNERRAIRDNLLVLVGLCTHLGCVPTYRPDMGSIEPDWKGGFFCPCHGSKFDLAGRVYRGVPAPTNLLVPPHRYINDSIILIGEDQKAT